MNIFEFKFRCYICHNNICILLTETSYRCYFCHAPYLTDMLFYPYVEEIKTIEI